VPRRTTRTSVNAKSEAERSVNVIVGSYKGSCDLNLLAHLEDFPCGFGFLSVLEEEAIDEQNA